MKQLNRMPDRFNRGMPPKKQFIKLLIVLDFLSLLIILILSSAYSAAQISRKREWVVAEKSREDLASEMKFLKSQINPHFLFNALNNIYSFTLTGSVKASEMILKLSAMLRYILYDCSVPFVAIEKEWDYILNFIDFQKLKSNEDLQLTLNFTNEAPSFQITPMIFIPFIENAFKHSNIENTKEGWIHISMNNKKEEIIFQVENSISSEQYNQDDVGGIGLENVRRRLELVYGENFDLIINDNMNTYSIVLRIKKK
jgi:LytS/YehU family sensor histidine kinase